MSPKTEPMFAKAVAWQRQPVLNLTGSHTTLNHRNRSEGLEFLGIRLTTKVQRVWVHARFRILGSSGHVPFITMTNVVTTTCTMTLNPES